MLSISSESLASLLQPSSRALFERSTRSFRELGSTSHLPLALSGSDTWTALMSSTIKVSSDSICIMPLCLNPASLAIESNFRALSSPRTLA
ncbi:hypothetical protein SE86_06235 [Acidilobus sp. 7A]|nr:hypothetical protein SE86_06235 [Acidilobus sp. 7A]